MNNLSGQLRYRFEEDLKCLPSDRFPSSLIQYKDVLKAHYFICDYFEVDELSSIYGIKDVNMLCSAVARQIVEFRGIRKWNDDFEIAATLFFGLVKNHPFHDGNKRTALLVLLEQLRRMGYTPRVDQQSFEGMTLLVAESNWERLFSEKERRFAYDDTDSVIRAIARKLRKMTRPIEGRFRPVTYFELANSLAKFDIVFKNPHRNTIDIFRRKPHVNFLGMKTSKMDEMRICNVAFPGMKRQVGRETLKEILKKIELDLKHGFDRACIFSDAEPLYKLIQDYEGPLSRLRDS